MTRHYHGTNVVMEPGEVVVPGAEVDASKLDEVWVTTDYVDARLWAQWAVSLRGGDYAHVYEVEPLDPPIARSDWWVCRRALVVRHIAAFAPDPAIVVPWQVFGRAVRPLMVAVEMVAERMRGALAAVSEALASFNNDDPVPTRPWKAAHARRYR